METSRIPLLAVLKSLEIYYARVVLRLAGRTDESILLALTILRFEVTIHLRAGRQLHSSVLDAEGTRMDV
jgi:hypothetical protein